MLPESGLRPPVHWRAPLVRLALAWGGLIALFLGEWAAMARQWWDSSTYTHILLVPAIVVWLVRLRAPQLAPLVPHGWWPGLVVLAAALFVWLLGSLSGLSLASQLGAVLMLQASVLALLGPRIGLAVLFPLVYMTFLVPFGDELVPPLQMITAQITITLTHLSGIAAQIEGVFIDTPVGLFEVAEACSGVKFLIAMIALGVLVAHVCFRSWWRRAAFMALAVLLPILANGVRAWGTIYIAQFQGVQFAAGFDHVFYGWIFFAVVMALLFAISWRFFDRKPEDAYLDPAVLDGLPLLHRAEGWRLPGWAVLGGMAAMVAGVIAWDKAALATEADLPARVVLPAVPGWHRVDHAPDIWWQPRAAGADHRLLGTYADGRGHQVEVFYALYAAQVEGREATGFGEGALVPGTAWRWLKPAPSIRGGKGEWLQADGVHDRLALTFYRIGPLVTGSGVRLKAAAMRDHLLMRPAPVEMLIVSAENHATASPRAAVESFMAAIDPTVSWMDRFAPAP